MADGSQHNLASFGSAIGVAAGVIGSYYFAVDKTPLIMLGAIIGFVFTPDMDHDARQSKFPLWKLWFAPYKYGFKHRSPWTHWPIISTAYMLVYLALPFTVIFIRDQTSTPRSNLLLLSLISQLIAIPYIALCWFLWYYGYIDYALPVIYGLFVSHILHWLLDIKLLRRIIT